MTTKIETFYYPNNINSPEFENRKVVFLSLTGKDILSSRADVYEKVKKGTDVEEEVDGMVVLPLNAAINDSQSHEWSEADYLSTVKNAISGGTELAKEKLTGKDADAATKAKWEGRFKKLGYGKIFLDMVSNMSGVVSNFYGTRKPMTNPGQFQNYTKSSLRSFSFEFVFIPENIKERDQVISIVQFFKRQSSPSLPFKAELNENDKNYLELLTETVMLSPHTWEIFVCNPHINKLMSFHECVCKNVSVTYGDSEKVAMFEDGMPKQISLKLDFAETSLQFAEAYGNIPQVGKAISDWAEEVKQGAEDAGNSLNDFSNGGFISGASLSVAKDVEAIKANYESGNYGLAYASSLLLAPKAIYNGTVSFFNNF